MYDTLIMLKPGGVFTVDDLYRLVTDAVQFISGDVDRDDDYVRVLGRSGSLNIVWNDAEHVAEESDEIAKRFGVPCEGCAARYEMSGDDPDMELFNLYLTINDRLQATGMFVIFDTQECKLLFEETEEEE
jgi:hypothetical protein